MKLYLTSYKMGDDSDRLLAMIAPRGRVAVISNALDNISKAAQAAYAAGGGFVARDWFAGRGLEAVDLDLRDFFGVAGAALEHALDETDLVWATGGNAFLLLRAIRQSRLQAPLERRLAEGSLVYGGWSAGACVAGTTLKGLDLVDDPHAVADRYDPEPPWAGMGLVDYAIVPHVRSDHPESEACGRTAAWLEEQGIPFRALRDGESIITGERD